MYKKLELAKEILLTEKYNLVIISGDEIIKSNERGIKTLLQTVSSNKDFTGAYAADRIVGKAAAVLYQLLGIKYVFAEVLSEAGKAVFDKNGLYYEYRILTDNIMNQMGTGLCPMEDAVKDISDYNAVFSALEQTAKEMAKRQLEQHNNGNS